jgi:hypothetical protein
MIYPHILLQVAGSEGLVWNGPTPASGLGEKIVPGRVIPFICFRFGKREGPLRTGVDEAGPVGFAGGNFIIL